MKVDVVVDVGNTRIKWGRCVRGTVVESVSLPHADPDTWQRQFEKWGLTNAAVWAIAAVLPAACDGMVCWLRERSQRTWVVESYATLPIELCVSRPDKVGIDRLLNAVAATRGKVPRRPAAIVDAGSAVTVDWIDEDGIFRGGAIFPGLRLMAKALHEHTALLPLVEITTPPPYLPGLSTVPAIKVGVYHAVAGGIHRLIGLLSAQTAAEPHIFLTGGDASLLANVVELRAECWPEMTLEGIRLSAEAQP